MELNFNYLFKVPLFAMRLNGSDPAIKRDVKWLAKFLIIHGEFTMMFLIVVQNIIFINLKENDFSQTCKNGVLTVVYTAITFQYSIMVWKQTQLKLLMDTVKRDYVLAKSLPEKEREIVRKFALMGEHVCKQWLIMTAVGTALFPIKNVVMITFYWVVKGEIFLLPMYELTFPAFIEDRKDNIFVYLFTYLTLFEYASYSSVMYCAFVPLGPIFLLHACGQLEVTKSRIENLFETDDLEIIRRNLKDIVKQLQIIYRFVDLIKSCFTIAYELTLKVTTILLPITCYEVIESLKHGELSLEFVVFIVGGVLFSSSPCFYGDLLMEKGESVRLAMYSSGWEQVYDHSIRSSVIIVLQRALRPVAIRTLFRTVCLDALTDLFQQSYTIFNLMNAAWN